MQRSILLLSLLLLVSGNIYAHTPLKSSDPANGASLQNAPKTLKFNFREAVSLVKVELLDATGNLVPIAFNASAQASSEYAIALPELNEDHYQVKWVAIGADTHKIDGMIEFTVNSDSPAASHSETEQHEHPSHH